MYRISITTLEKFRRCMLGLTSFDTEEALIASIAGTFEGNDKTKVGSAFHAIIEDPTKLQLYVDTRKGVISDDILFTPEQAAPAFEYREKHPTMIHEFPYRKFYKTSKYDIQISGKVDGIEGRWMRDAKTKFRSVSFTEYYDSYQWRFYLDMLQLDIFYYDLFEVKGFKELQKKIPYTLPGVSIIAHEPFQCIRYPTLQQDCQKLLEQFMDYIDNRNFHHLLKTEIKNETALL